MIRAGLLEAWLRGLGRGLEVGEARPELRGLLEACIEGEGRIRGWSRAFLKSSLHVTGARTEEVSPGWLGGRAGTLKKGVGRPPVNRDSTALGRGCQDRVGGASAPFPGIRQTPQALTDPCFVPAGSWRPSTTSPGPCTTPPLLCRRGLHFWRRLASGGCSGPGSGLSATR